MWGFWKLSFQNWCSDCMELVGYLFFGITGTFFVMWSVTELWTVHLKLKQIYTLDMKLNNWRICYVIQILAVSLLIFVWFALYVSEKSVWNCWFVCFFMVLSAVQSLSHVQLFATPWTTARQASLSITNSRSPPKTMSIHFHFCLRSSFYSPLPWFHSPQCSQSDLYKMLRMIMI